MDHLSQGLLNRTVACRLLVTLRVEILKIFEIFIMTKNLRNLSHLVMRKASTS